MSVAFDTLKFAQTLRDKAKLSTEQAEGISQAFAEASSDQLATKDDVAALAAKLDGLATKLDGFATKEKLDGVATKLDGVATKLDGFATKEKLDGVAAKLDGFATKDELKAGLAGLATKDELKAGLAGLATKDELKAGLAETKAELLKWMFGQTLLIIGVLMALLRFGH